MIQRESCEEVLFLSSTLHFTDLAKISADQPLSVQTASRRGEAVSLEVSMMRSQ